MPGKRKSKKERKEEITNAIYNIAIRDGLDKVTLRSVAKEANLSHGLVGFYFPQKKDLMHSLFDRILDWLSLNSESKMSNTSPAYIEAITSEIIIDENERPVIRLLLEFWILSLTELDFKERIKEAINLTDKYFSKKYEMDKINNQAYTKRFQEKNIKNITTSLILGNALLDLIYENRDKNMVPLDVINYLFK